MIDYVFIILAVVCFTLQFAFAKLYESEVGQTSTSSLVMIVGTSLVGAIIFFLVNGLHVNFSPVSIFWAVIFAVIMIPYYLIGVKVLSLGSLAIYSMFMMLGGMLVPFFYGILLLKEELTIGKVLGTILLTTFIVLQAVWQNEPTKKESDKKVKYLFFILCIIIFFVNGMTAVVAKAHSISEGAVDESSFTTISCLFTMILSFTILVISFVKEKKEKMVIVKSSLKKKPLGIMTLLGGAAYGGNFLLLLAADKVPASIQFPLVSGGVIVLSALASYFVFKEKLSKKEWISILGAFISTVLFAF